jgi:integrin-linked kinase-associated serine/threonine phosphatase 2C
MSPPIVSTPKKDKDAEVQKQNFGAHEILGRRDEQEDALAQQHFENDELGHLTPEQIGQRLWTTYRELHAALKKQHPKTSSGTTASTTIIHQNHLITATLADAVSFAVIYGQDNAVLGVKRLNVRTHSPELAEEKDRITALGGTIADFDGITRVCACETPVKNLNLSRAIGDFDCAPYLIADADINITSVSELARELRIDPKDITKTQIITTCDGFTEPATMIYRRFEQAAHANFLKGSLKTRHITTELELAKQLTQAAFKADSEDNISVAVQTIPPNYSGMLGVYDGHGGTDASHFVAKNISQTLLAQCQLTEADYAKQEHSVQHNHAVYARDNKKYIPDTSKSSHAVMLQLEKKLEPIEAQLNRLKKRKNGCCETQLAKDEIQPIIHALGEMVYGLRMLDTSLPQKEYIEQARALVNADMPPEIKHARGTFSLHRMLQRLSDWLTSCYQKLTHQDVTPNTHRFFKTTTEYTLDALSSDVNHMTPRV